MKLLKQYILIFLMLVTFQFSCGSDVDEEKPVDNDLLKTQSNLINSNEKAVDNLDTKEVGLEYSWDKITKFYSETPDLKLNIDSGLNTLNSSKNITYPFSVQDKDSSQIIFSTTFSKDESQIPTTITAKESDVKLWTDWLSFIYSYPELFTRQKSTININNKDYETISFSDIPVSAVLLFMKVFYLADDRVYTSNNTSASEENSEGTVNNTVISKKKLGYLYYQII